ncbi:pyridoxamine 5'-phosphate oxidase family protein [Pseudonocardia nigra]|uniref:pyridoxamine 5'-phosphate oxidase family protein n=1 Tax=Pseudonocardia nigra TaxID=1921578 RepID=UPI001C5D8C49|nr:pyridoxamine 5'-phosphate oxidase family protein [Pseudonocardia nigra]
MYETELELRDLQALLDGSLARSTAHLRSIIRSGESTLTAEQLVRVLNGMFTLALSTVTARGEPRISGADGHFLHGRWVFGTSRTAAKARHLRARPAASCAYMRGEEVGVFAHGVAETLNPADGPAAPDWPEIREYLHQFYGDTSFDWSDAVFYRLQPTWMTAYASAPEQLLAELGHTVATG